MSNKNINIVNRKKTNIKDKEMKNSLIAMFLLPSLVLKDENDKIENSVTSYSFLEDENNGLLYKFKKSIPYFKKLKKEFIDKNYIVESDDFFEINSVDLFALQTITEFANNKFTYKTNKNYYKALLENTEFFELSEKIVLLNKYITSLSNLFNIIESNLFDLSSGMTISIEDYISKFERDKVMISDLLFGRNIKLQDLIKKIKLFSYENDKRLIEKVKQLELDYDNNGFLYKDDFLKFLFYTMEEIKFLFSSIIVELIPAIEELWKIHEMQLEEKEVEEKRIKEEADKKIAENDDIKKLKNISLQKNKLESEMIIEEFDDSNLESKNDNMIIEEFNDSTVEFENDDMIVEEHMNSKSEDEVIEWIKKDKTTNNIHKSEDIIQENEEELDGSSFNEEDLELWNTMVDVNDEDFESKKNECDENAFISETEDMIYDALINEINDIEEDEEEAITKNMDSLINEIKDSIEKDDNSNEEFEY